MDRIISNIGVLLFTLIHTVSCFSQKTEYAVISKIKTLVTLLMFFLFSVSQSFAQNIVSFSKLKERDNKLYLGEQVYSGLVLKTFITNQPKSLTEIKDGNINGKVIEFIEDLSFVSYAYRDTAKINSISYQISSKKQELEQAIQDTVKASKEQNDFLNYQIGGNEKLLKLKEKDAEGKLNKNKKEIYDKYEQYVQINKQCFRKFNDIQLQINNLNQQIKSENDKPTYIPKNALEYSLLNGVKEGAAIIYDSLGNKFGEGSYLNGKQNGKWVYYFSNGNLKAHGNFKNGDGGDISFIGIPRNGREGKWTLYFESGKLSQESSWTNGQGNGDFKSYFENGSIEEERSSIDGKLNGIRKIYFENGIIKEDSFYKDNVEDGLRKLYFSNGNLKQTGTFINGLPSGHFVFFYESGSIQSEVDYKEGQKNGLKVDYDEEGKKKAEYYVKNDIKHGNEKIYFTNGKLKEERTYKMGKDHGNTKIYYESGVLQTDAQFVNGTAHGPMKIFYESGKLHYSAFMDSTSLTKNKIFGELIEYNEDGSLKAKVFVDKNGVEKVIYKEKSKFEIEGCFQKYKL
jgi:antitoxin component YwqK of YwqJK toxin-antitoxin module